MAETITIRLPPGLIDRLPAPSLVRGEGRNAFVVQAILEKLEREEVSK